MKNNSNESGAALIVVLGVLSLLAILAASLVMISKTSASIASLGRDFVQSAYNAEGLASRVRWHIMQENLMPSNDEDEKEYKAIGYEKTVEYNGVEMRVAVTDMNAGLSFPNSTSSNAYSSLFKHLRGEGTEATLDKNEAVDSLVDVIIDYIDKGDTLRQQGAEKTDYESDGKAPLPRNGKLQYREELCWIPNFSEFYKQDEFGRLRDFNVIKAGKLKNPSLYAVSMSLIKSKVNLTETEIESLKSALKELKENNTPLDETLDGVLLSKLKKHFKIKESGYYTLIIRGPKDEPSRTYIVSMKIGKSMGGSGIKYYEHALY